MASEGLHEAADRLTVDVVDMHRALVSLGEELEAVDWYNQRVAAATDGELKTLLAHNRDEEKEHAAMLVEWIRRRDPIWHEQLQKYLYSSGPIVGEEATQLAGEVYRSDLGIGPLRARKVSRRD